MLHRDDAPGPRVLPGKDRQGPGQGPRARHSPARGPLPPQAGLLALQGSVGNQAVARLVGAGTPPVAVQRDAGGGAGSPDGGVPSGTVSISYGPADVAGALLEEHRDSEVPVRFDPRVGEAVAAASAALPAAELAYKTLESLTASRLEIAESRMARVAADAGVPAESVGFLFRHGLKTGAAKAAEALAAIAKVRQLGDAEQRAEWERIQATYGTLGDLQVGAAVGEIAVAVTGGAITVIGAASGAVWGAGGKGAVAGMVAVLGSQGAKAAGKLLGAAGAVFEIVKGAAQMANAESDADFASGAFSVGMGAGSLTGMALGAGAAGTLGAGLLAGGVFALEAWLFSQTDDIAAGFTALELSTQEKTLRRQGAAVARHATWTKRAVGAHGDALAIGDPAILQRLRAHSIRAGQHLADSLYKLIGPRPGAVGHAVRAHLLKAVGGREAVPTAETVRMIELGVFGEAQRMVWTADQAVAALEQVFYDPKVRSTIIWTATKENFKNR